MIDLDYARRHLKNAPEDDALLSEMLISAESAVRAYTHNRFPDGLSPDVQKGIIDMVQYQIDTAKRTESGKQNVASETLSRHSVTYAKPDEDKFCMGYPLSVMGFCKPYRRPRT